MNKLLLPRWIILGVLLFMSPSQMWAMDRQDLLTQARAYVEQGKQTEAIDTYLNYIATHPVITGKKSPSYKKSLQYYLRNLLIAFSNLIEIQQVLGRSGDVQNSLNQLKIIQHENKFGSKNLYSLAKIYKDHGATQEALNCLTVIVSDQKRTPRKTNNKVFARACADLLEIHKDLGQDREIAEIISTISDSLDKFDFDLKDRFQIATILLENGNPDAAKKILNRIVQDADLGHLAGEEDAVVRSIIKLLDLNATDKVITERLVATLDQFSNTYELSPRNQYFLGIACLNAGQEDQGLSYLERVKKNSPETTYARKALFVLGRRAASSSDWDKAIHCYSEYIQKYPEPRFFSLKAYSRLIDCHWAKFKDPGLIDSEARHLADIVNDVSDFETKLNLARDLKDKGFDELAEATFDLGMVDAQNRLQVELEADERLRILWIIQKYAYSLEKFLLVETSSEETLDLLSDLKKESLKTSEKELYFKSQAYIWLAQTYQKTKRNAEAINTFSEFLTEFHESRDANYVRFSLAEIYEEKGDLSLAKGLYENIDGGVWKERASKKLNKQGHSL